MSLSEIEIGAVVEELSSLCGAIVQKVWSIGKQSLALRLRTPGESHLLALVADPPLTRIHLCAERPPSSPETSSLQAYMRRELEGLRVESIAQINHDRIVEIVLVGRKRLILVGELMGRRGAIHLLDEERVILYSTSYSGRHSSNRVEGGVEGVDGDVDGERPVYAPPPTRAHGQGKKLENRFDKSTPQDTSAGFPLNKAIDALFTPMENQKAIEEERKRLLRPVKVALKRIDKALERLEEEAERSLEAQTYRRYGDLLKTSLHQIKRGESSVELIDWYSEGQPKTAVPLRRELSAKENMDRYFKLARRLGNARDRVQERKGELIAKRPALQNIFDVLTDASDLETFDSISSILKEHGLYPETVKDARAGRSKASGGGTRKPYRQYKSISGRDILVGRGSSDNDELTFKVARGNDLWFHIRGQPGSHVVVPVTRGDEVDEQTILDAGTLAAHFSSARGEITADLAWTMRKHVRKPKGAPPGLVAVSQERGLMLRMEPERLKRLLGGPSAHEPIKR